MVYLLSVCEYLGTILRLDFTTLLNFAIINCCFKVRFFTSLVPKELLSADEQETMFDQHPQGGMVPRTLPLTFLAPLAAAPWKRRQQLLEYLWENKEEGQPATEAQVARAVEVAYNRIDAMASDSFMDRARNRTLATLMPTWTLSLPSTREYVKTDNFYLCMRESDPDALNLAYRKSSTPPLLVFKPDGEATAQREVMLGMVLCNKCIEFMDERMGHRAPKNSSEHVVMYAAGQYCSVKTGRQQLRHGYGPGEQGLVGAILPLLLEYDPVVAHFIAGTRDTFQIASEDREFTNGKCF